LERDILSTSPRLRTIARMGLSSLSSRVPASRLNSFPASHQLPSYHLSLLHNITMNYPRDGRETALNHLIATPPDPSTAISLRTPNHILQLRLRKTAAENKQTGDNFYNPENDFFYKHSPYLPLESSLREIRLLRVFPARRYADHIAAKPEWAVVDQADGRPLRPIP
jgi:hypothetical protein